MTNDLSKMKVLEMLAEGKVTPEEAAKLLEALAKEHGPRDSRRWRDDDHDDDDFDEEDFEGVFGQIGEQLSGIASEIGDSIKEGLEGLKDLDVSLDLGDIFVGGYKGQHSFVSQPVSQNIMALRLLAKNDKIEISSYEGREVRISCEYKSKKPRAGVRLSEEGGVYELLYDYNAMRSMRIYAQVPAGIRIEEIGADTKNAKIYVGDVLSKAMRLGTTNDKIVIERSLAEEINAKTSNAAIMIEQVRSGGIFAETTNAKIKLEHTQADTARLQTTQAKIVTENTDIAHLYAKTKNAGIVMENNFGEFAKTGGQGAERTIEAHTTNGGVSLDVTRGVAVNLQASTSNSKVDCRLANLLMGETAKSYVSARSYDYDSTAARAKINISTTNSAIKIKEA